MKKLMIFVFGLFFATSLWAVPNGYQVITPDDTIKFPTTLQGYTQRTFTSNSGWELVGGGASIYLYLVLSSGDITVSGTKAYNNLTVIGSPTSTNTAAGAGIYYSSGTNATRLRIRDSSLFTDSTTFDTYLKAHPLTFLYKITTPTDNEYFAVRNLTTGELGYYCESGTNAGSFVPVFGMTTSTPVSRCPVGQVEQTYTTATGTVTQNGTPTPNAPVEPVFYKQGQMILRKIDDTYKDTYDAVTGKITRRVKVLELDGTENWFYRSSDNYYLGYMYNLEVSDMYTEASSVKSNRASPYSTHFTRNTNWISSDVSDRLNKIQAYKPTSVAARLGLGYPNVSDANIPAFKQWLAAQKSAGTPVIVYYPLAEANWYTEDWAAEQCESSSPIKIATTKYNNTAFQPVLTVLNNAVDTIKTVVANTITQATAVANLQSGKQTMPNSTTTNGTCPNYRQCLLVEDNQGNPYWYEIMDPFYNLFSAVIPNNVSTDSVTSQNAVPSNYTQLEYIESEGTQYINTNVWPSEGTRVETTVQGTDDQGIIFSFDQDWPATYVGTSSTHVYRISGATSGYSTVPATTKADITSVWTGASGDITMTTTINNETLSVHTTRRYSGNSTNGPFHLFVGANYLTPVSLWVGKMYSFKIYKNNGLVMDLVPAKQGVTVGMYDLVTGNFLTSAASGTNFKAGPVVQNQQALWTMAFGANAPLDARYMVNGSAVCNAALGAANTAATLSQMSANNWTSVGSNCWCSIDMVTEQTHNNSSTGKNIWVWLEVPSGETCAADCASNCADAMASGVAADKPFRQAMTGM